MMKTPPYSIYNALMIPLLLLLAACGTAGPVTAADRLPGDYLRGQLLYASPLSTREQARGWILEGPGEVTFAGGWMQLRSPGQYGSIVSWCPLVCPDSFVAEWDVQQTEAGPSGASILVAAEGASGEDLFAPSLPNRTGQPEQYDTGAIRNYRLVYDAHGKDASGDGKAEIRKSPDGNLVAVGEKGLSDDAALMHHMCLIKDGGHLMLFDNGRRLLDWTDQSPAEGAIYTTGRLGLWQEKWTGFRYKNFQVHGLVHRVK